MTRLLLTAWLGLAGATAQSPSDLTGVWVREATSRPVLDDAAPAWEEITIEATQVTIRRASRPRAIEVYRFDGLERQATRVRASRYCRVAWDGAALTLDCRELDGGPGGSAPPIVTREVRSLDAEGRLIVETGWSSGEQVTVRRERYRRQAQ